MFKKIQKDLSACSFFLLLSVLFFGKNILENKIVWGQDTPKIVFPFISLLDESFKHFKLPLWTPNIYFGFPVGGDGQIPWYYPFSILHIFLPLHFTVTFLSIFHVFLAGFFTYLFARSINLSRFASIFAGIAFMFNGFMIAHMQYFSHIYAYAYLPLILLLLELAISRSNRFYFVLAGTGFGLQVLSGHPNIPIMTMIYTSLYALFRLRDKIAEFFVGIFIILSVAFTIALPYILVILSLIPLSIRGGGVNFVDATNSSFSLFDLITFVFPNFFFTKIVDSWAFASTWHFWGYWGQIETIGYVGILTLLFSLFSFYNKERQWSSIFISLLLISFILALGKNTPLYGLLLHIPIFNGLRAPGRFLYLVDFSLIILAGLGIMTLSKQLNNFRIRINFILFLTLLSLTSFLLIAFMTIKYYPESTLSFLRDNYGKLGYVQDLDKPDVFLNMVMTSFKSQTFIGLTLLILGSALIFLYTNGVKNYVLKFAILSLLIFDLFIFGGKVNRWVDYESLFNRGNDTISTIQQELNNNSGRIYTFNNFWSDLMPDQLLTYHIPESNGFASLPLKRYENWQKLAEDRWQNNNPGLFQIGSIKYVYSLKDGNATLTAISDWLPRAYVINNWISVKTNTEALNFLSSEDFNPKTVIIETNEMKDFKNTDSPSITPAVISIYRPDYVKIISDTSYDGLLVLTDTNYPGWQAYLNGRNIPIYQANYLFRAVKIPAGLNTIEFKYQPVYLNIAFVLSIGSILVISSFSIKKLLNKR